MLADGALGRADRGQKRTDVQCGPERDTDLSVAGEGALLVRSAAEARELRQKEPSLPSPGTPPPAGASGPRGAHVTAPRIGPRQVPRRER